MIWLLIILIEFKMDVYITETIVSISTKGDNSHFRNVCVPVIKTNMDTLYTVVQSWICSADCSQ